MTQLLLADNNAVTTLGSALASGATTLTVSTGTGSLFPSPNPSLDQYFNMTLWSGVSNNITPNEIVRCTQRVGDSMTVARAQEGTTALNWAIGDNVANFFTAGDLANFAQQDDIQQQAGNFAPDSGTANAGVVALEPAPPSMAYMTGAPIRVRKVGAANTGAYTLDIGLGPTSVLLPNGATLTGGELPASGIFTVIYDGAALELQSLPGVQEPNSVVNSRLAQGAAGTIKGNFSGVMANMSDNPLASFLDSFMGLTGVIGATGYLVLPVYDVDADAVVPFYVQWATVTLSPGGASFYNAAISFDVEFPNECIGVVGNGQHNIVNNPTSSGSNTTAIFYSYGQSGCMVRIDGDSGSAISTPQPVFYIAIGK